MESPLSRATQRRTRTGDRNKPKVTDENTATTVDIIDMLLCYVVNGHYEAELGLLLHFNWARNVTMIVISERLKTFWYLYFVNFILLTPLFSTIKMIQQSSLVYVIFFYHLLLLNIAYAFIFFISQDMCTDPCYCSSECFFISQ